jgi:hypothetical protein
MLTKNEGQRDRIKDKKLIVTLTLTLIPKNPKRKTQNLKPKTQNPKPKTQNPKSKIPNPNTNPNRGSHFET